MKSLEHFLVCNIFFIISRVLAEVVDEDQLLVVVCKSMEAARSFGKSIYFWTFSCICLEDIRFYGICVDENHGFL
jgi:hypothetical protein